LLDAAPEAGRRSLKVSLRSKAVYVVQKRAPDEKDPNPHCADALLESKLIFVARKPLADVE
jgi:hypothetical protein